MQKLSSPTAKSGLKAGLCLPLFLLVAQFGLPQPSTDLEQVLNQMDEAATKFRTAQANFTWVQYNKLSMTSRTPRRGRFFFAAREKTFKWPPISASQTPSSSSFLMAKSRFTSRASIKWTRTTPALIAKNLRASWSSDLAPADTIC